MYNGTNLWASSCIIYSYLQLLRGIMDKYLLFPLLKFIEEEELLAEHNRPYPIDASRVSKPDAS